MDIYRVSFIGHRELSHISPLEDRIEAIARELIDKKDYVEFYVGRNGDFDTSAASAVKRAQKALGHHNSVLMLVLPYHDKDEEYYKRFYDEICLPISEKIHFKAIVLFAYPNAPQRLRYQKMTKKDFVIAFDFN